MTPWRLEPGGTPGGSTGAASLTCTKAGLSSSSWFSPEVTSGAGSPLWLWDSLDGGMVVASTNYNTVLGVADNSFAFHPPPISTTWLGKGSSLLAALGVALFQPGLAKPIFKSL